MDSPEFLALDAAVTVFNKARKAQTAAFDKCFVLVHQNRMAAQKADPTLLRAKGHPLLCKNVGDFLQTYAHIYQRVL